MKIKKKQKGAIITIQSAAFQQAKPPVKGVACKV